MRKMRAMKMSDLEVGFPPKFFHIKFEKGEYGWAVFAGFTPGNWDFYGTGPTMASCIDMVWEYLKEDEYLNDWSSFDANGGK